MESILSDESKLTLYVDSDELRKLESIVNWNLMNSLSMNAIKK